MMTTSPQLRMYLDRFYNLPRPELGEGMAIRRFVPGDEVLWAALLQRTGELGEWSVERAKKALTGEKRIEAEGIHFLLVDGRTVATACFSVSDRNTAEAALEWVAVDLECKGRRFGFTICAAVLACIAEAGYRRCILRTDDHRLAAIKTYLRLGFTPDMQHPSYRARWEAIWRKLGLYPRRPYRLGIVGRRGSSTIHAARSMEECEVAAVCDIDEATLRQMADQHGIRERFTSYERMLAADIDAVVVSTPMPLHVPQAVAALRAGKHVLSEVPAAISLAECWELLEAVANSESVYMMAENCCYMQPNILVKALIQQGLFGEVYFGQGEYIHELKSLNEQTPWRRIWQTGRNGNTYPTHSLGPLMQWMNDRVVEVSCLGSGHHYKDPRGLSYENEDTTMTLCKLENGGLVQLRLDMLSNRPHNMTYYTLQGTKGCYEAARGLGDQPKVWMADFCDGPEHWRPLADFEEYLPALWRDPPAAARAAGHGGGDYWEVLDFIDAICLRQPSPIDVVTALEWTAVGLCSQKSIDRGGIPVELPDFRAAWRAKGASAR